ncbi:MAG: hypothetical protein LCI00_20405 [Chloroflexi bacterium]|nr:hypothetical protein [Chloroflexota bacterium]MCC6893721.1 hypothetical protein [Anaerolineae bacterium]
MGRQPLTPEHLAFLERRYVDLKQVYEAMISYYPPDAYEENYLFETIVCEFNYLADTLGYENDEAFLDRLMGDSDADEIDDDADFDSLS